MTGSDRLRVHAFVECSRANGPGARAVLWVQGCTLACPGCFNPQTHRRAGDDVGVGELADRIAGLAGRIEGLTISGGEPLQQRPGVLALLARLRARTSLSTLVFTGYRYPEVARMPELPALWAGVDVLVAGRYERERRLGRGLLGSANQTVHFFSDRYTLADVDDVPTGEVLVGPDGEVTITGVDPPTIDADVAGG